MRSTRGHHKTLNLASRLLNRSGLEHHRTGVIFVLCNGMKRIGILTAGGDTPALNATIHGAVVRANQLKVEIYGLVKGFNCLFNPRVPHVHLNPLYQEIPELDPTKGGTLIGSSRDYVDPEKKDELDAIEARLTKLGIEGLICIGGDGTLNGLQPIAERLPTPFAPKNNHNTLAPKPPP